MQTETIIRPFTTDDYAVVAELRHACFPEIADTAEGIAYGDSIREPYIKAGRWLAVQNGTVVGMAAYAQRESNYHPHRFRVDINIAPEWQRKGIGRRLLAHLEEMLAPHQPELLVCRAKQGHMGGPEFLCKCSFVETYRDWESRLRLAEFVADTYADVVAGVAAQGISIVPLAALMDQPDGFQKLYEMDWQVATDMPNFTDHTKPTFEYFLKRTVQNPRFFPDGWFIALDGDRFVGESRLVRPPTGKNLLTGATGVLPEYRRRGIATALKVHALQFAKAYGSEEITTWNDSTNEPMLAINRMLGFVQQPPWLWFEKTM